MLASKTLRATCLVIAAAAQPIHAQAPASPNATTSAKAPAPSTASLMRQANAAREAGDLERAIELYRRVTKAAPSQREAWWHSGTSLYELERWAEARTAFDRVVRLDSTNAAALAFRGLCAFKQGEYSGALADLLRARALGVGSNAEVGSVARFHAGLAMVRLGQFDQAAGSLGELANEGNDSPQVIEALGVATLRMPLLPSEVPAEKREMVMMAGRGAYFMASRLSPAARSAFEELALRYPDHPNVHYAFGVFLLNDNADRALAEFQRELSIQPAHAASHIQMASEFVKRGDLNPARAHADRAVALAPDDFTALRLLGQIQLEAGEVPAAIVSLERSRRLEPSSPAVYFTLARAYARAGRDADAARARAEFTRLDRRARQQRNGASAVGGMIP